MGSKASSHSHSSQSSHHRRRRQHRDAGRLLLVLHSLNVTFSLVSTGIFIAVIPIWNANFFHSTGPVRGDWPDSLPIIPLVLTFIASSHYLIRFVVTRKASTKPGDYLRSRRPVSGHQTPSKVRLCVTITTLILLLTFIILSGISGLYRFWRPAVITSSVHFSSGMGANSTTLSTLSLRHLVRSISDSTPINPSVTPPTNSPSTQSLATSFHSCTLANVFTRRCNPTIYLIGDLQIAAISTGSLVWILNLIIFVLLIREHLYQKRRHQRSIRARAKAKLDMIEDEMSRAEKGTSSTQKKIHLDRNKRTGKPAADPAQMSVQPSHIARPVRAYAPTGDRGEIRNDVVRPKQHYYDPNITPSRSRSGRHAADTLGGQRPYDASTTQGSGQTAYSKAVEEARRKVKPTETMRDWLASR